MKTHTLYTTDKGKHGLRILHNEMQRSCATGTFDTKVELAKHYIRQAFVLVQRYRERNNTPAMDFLADFIEQLNLLKKL